ncbi:caldesmon-like [Leptopilina boulardi]|uniref:caldesmon-like n=1 Tax=Leptopilina boulardi TaxID=63433 RepID=UPI0021F54647|nr:caldesmon-like [Leptopilina boulardi]
MYDPDDDDDDDTNSTASVTSGRRRRLSTNFAPVNEDSSCSSFTGKFKILDLDLRSCEEMLVDAEHEAMEIDQQQPATDSSLKKRKVASTDKGTPPVIKKAKKISRHSSPTAAGAKDRVTKLKEDKIKQVEKKVEGKRKQQPSKPTTSKAKNRGGNASDDDEPMIVDESSETCEEEGKSSKERMKESNKKKGKLKARIQKRKVQKSYAIYMSLNSILQKDDNNVMKNKIEHDVRNSSRMKILTAIFVNYLMNKPDCRLAEEYAITGFEHYRIMNCFKERTENVYNNCKKKDPELYQLFEEFKKEMADEENEIDQLLFKKFEELHGKKKWWQKNQERLEEYNKFRIEMLTIVNCKFETDLLLQASREMDKDLRVHLHQQGPKMLLKYLKFKEFGIPQQEESDKKKVPEKDKKLVEKKTKKNEKRLENFKKKGNQRKEENQRREGIIPTSEELKQARKNKQQSAREKAKAAYTKKPCKNQEIKKITKQLKRDENKSEKERERNQRERIRKKEEKIEKRKQKNENKEQIFTFKKSGKKECWTSKEMKEKNKNVEKALINLLIYDMCYDDTLYGYLEDIQRKTEELKEIRLKREKEKEEKKKKKVNQEQNDKGKKEKKLEKIEKEEVGLLNFQDLDIPHLCYKFLPLFMRMQRELVDSGAKGFVLFPMKRFGLHHATYTETVLERDVLNYLKNLTTESTEKEQVDKIREKLIKVDPTEREKEKNVAKLKKKYDNLKTLWEALFDLKKVKDKHKNKRACSVPRCMQTDGVKVSLIFDLKKEKQEEETLPSSGNQKKTKKKKKIKYQRFVGLDPGLKAMFGGGMREDDPHIKKDERTKKVDKKQHTLIYANTKTFRFRNGELRRKSLLHKYSKDIDERYNNFMKKNEKYNKVDKNDPTKYLLLAKFYLKQFEIKQDKLTERCFRNLKFNKLIMVQREMDRVVNFIMGDNVKKEPCFVAIGSTKINPCMKGHVKTPIMKIEKRLRERSKQVGEERLKVVSAYEGYTTKMCSSCNQKNIVSRSPKRYAFCQNCHVVWNRDVNAGINILNIALINEEILEAADIPNSEVFPGIISATDM